MMFDTLLAWFEIPVVLYAYLLGAGGMALCMVSSLKVTGSTRFSRVFLRMLYISTATVGWPFVLVWWVFDRMNHWRQGG